MYAHAGKLNVKEIQQDIDPAITNFNAAIDELDPNIIMEI